MYRSSVLLVSIAWITLSSAPNLVLADLITLKDGSVIKARNEPEFESDEGFYKFKDSAGKKISLNKDEVRKIEETDEE